MSSDRRRQLPGDGAPDAQDAAQPGGALEADPLEPGEPRSTEGVPVSELISLTPPGDVARQALNRARAAARARPGRGGGARLGALPGCPAPANPRGAAAERPGEGRTRSEALRRDARGAPPAAGLGPGGVRRWRHRPVARGGGQRRGRPLHTGDVRGRGARGPSRLDRLGDADPAPRPPPARAHGEGGWSITVLGPVGPGFGRGPRSVRGRGARDTYG